MSTAAQPMYEWNTIPWAKLERVVYKLQKRIYRASQRGDVKTVHRLQRLLLTSKAAKQVAVRKVTQDNRGKNTAGVDGVKRFSPPQRSRLAATLTLTADARPTRRVWIPKPGNVTEQRPLGIPVMRNRAEQALAKLALEPEWEAHFEPNSYGFRPGRSAHDAIAAIFNTIRYKPKYVLDADIAKCFDRINHAALLHKLHTFARLRRAIKAWLTAGVLENGAFHPTPAGTPQGGVISPLLANIALHGLETTIRATCGTQVMVIRYADDFVALHPEETVVRRVQQVATAWLGSIGLELKPSKTRVAHTLQACSGHVGFDFLGFHVRQHRVGKTHSGKNTNGVPLGFKTIITPSNATIRRHAHALRAVVQRDKGGNQASLITHLNPLIRGWTRYYATVVAKQTFAHLDYLLYEKLRAWAYYQHPHKRHRWIATKYWHPNDGGWTFAVQNGPVLYHHSHTPIRRHTKVVGTKSPFDGDWWYWMRRLQRHPLVRTRVATLLMRDHGRCNWCGLYFRDGDQWEIDHIVPIQHGGRDVLSNLQLLHQHCHDTKSASDRAGPM